MLVTQRRPRNLQWHHSGPMLFGDWGTSRMYVLGLAFYYTAHASVLYLAVMSVIMAGVAWAYTVVCRSFPDGGGVYASARRINPTLSVIGGTLLLCDYIVTAALSCVEGFHYFGTPAPLVVPLCLVTIIVIGVINWFGARNAGRLALLIALAAIAASAVIALFCLPYLSRGAAAMTAHADGVRTPWQQWESLVRIVLALSGVESVANMTGLMHEPVARTARRTIWPVLIEVVVLNMVFMVALNGLPQFAGARTPDYVTHEVRAGIDSGEIPAEIKEYRDTPMRLLATEAASNAIGSPGGRVFGLVAGAVFGLLLLSAVNTAVGAMVAVMYSMSRDRELPRPLTRLNYSGVPWVGLILAVAAPCVVLLIKADPKALGELYAIGVVGAITINLLSCAWNRELAMKRWERAGMWGLGMVMLVTELTIIYVKRDATIFAGIVVAAVLGARFVVRLGLRRVEAAVLPEPVTGWLAEIKATPTTLAPGRPRIMLAARGRYQAEFAVDLARRRRAILFGIYVRTLRVMDVQPGAVPRIEDDKSALESLGTIAVLARQAGVPFFPIYVTSTAIADEILDYTVTFGCDTLIMGKSRRSLFARRLEGDVVTQVAANLPDEVSLITRATDAPFSPPAADRDDGTTPPPP